MFKRKSEPKQKLLEIEVSEVVLKDGSSFNAVEGVSEIAKRIDLKNDFIYIHEFISTKQIKPKLVRVSFKLCGEELCVRSLQRSTQKGR